MRVYFSLRMALAAVLIVVLFRSTLLLIGFIAAKTGLHIARGLLGIAGAILAALILVSDALRVRVRLNDLEAAQFPPGPGPDSFSG